MVSSQTKAALEMLVSSNRLPASFLDNTLPLYSQVARSINTLTQDSSRSLFVGLVGSQGSGKSTAALFLAELLKLEFSLQSVVISIDDFYLTKSQRSKLATEVHPLLATRGVPGTHDIALLENTLESLQSASEETVTLIPTFNKAIDDRFEQTHWQSIQGKPDIVILEGWCVGIGAQKDADIHAPVNELEASEDASGAWRRHVNQALEGDYASLYSRFDQLIALIAPSFACVHGWRTLQEDKLRQKIQESGSDGSGLMSADEIHRFISHYQRLTKHGLATLPDHADWVLYLNEHHQFTDIRSKA
ncbi:MAG: phosphoribulokinase [Pseudomonadota bacterium]